MNTETFFAILHDGRVQKVSLTATDIDIKKDILSQFAVEAGCKIKNLIDAGILGEGTAGKIGLCAKRESMVFTIPVGVIPMKANFVIKDDILMPDFASATSATSLMDLKWQVPHNKGMRVFLMVYCPVDSAIYSETQFLLAMDEAGRTYRLPTSNCYEDCKLCTGDYISRGNTYMDVLCRAWEQFTHSNWQSDLNNRGGAKGMENSKNMFRFKPLEKEGFEQLPMNCDNWTTLCTKIGNEFINSNIVI